MIVDRYYYDQLNKQEQTVYQAFYNGVMEQKELIPLSVSDGFIQESFGRIFRAMTRDNPLIYFLNQSACSIASDRFGRVAICPQYFFTKEKVKEYNRKIEKTVNELAGQLQLLECCDYEKELRIHDWICRNITYDYEGADKEKVSRVIASHNILGVFGHHKAQCEGIAKAVKVLLNAVNVKCIVAAGDTVEKGKASPHAWNIVNIDGAPYQLDVTWDIGMGGQRKGAVVYAYFNLTDELMHQDHRADSRLPECRAKAANYYVQSRCSFQMKQKLIAYIDKQIDQNEKTVVFRAEGRLNKGGIEKEAADYILKKLQRKGRWGGIRTYSNKKLGIYRIEIISR